MLTGYLNCEQRCIAQKDPAKITFFTFDPTQPDPIGYAWATV